MVNQGQMNQAQRRIADARKVVLPVRRAISAAMRRIYDIEADFIETSGAV
jgi:hypothetical protein